MSSFAVENPEEIELETLRHKLQDCLTYIRKNELKPQRQAVCPKCAQEFRSNRFKRSKKGPVREGGKRSRRTRKKRRRIGKEEKETKRLKAQYRRFRIATGDKRFKGTKNLVKWSRKSKAKRKGKKRSRRIYHRKRK